MGGVYNFKTYIMPPKKRYVAVVEFYVWADSDQQAVAAAKKFCEKQRIKKDNGCDLISMAEQPEGLFKKRVIDIYNPTP